MAPFVALGMANPGQPPPSSPPSSPPATPPANPDPPGLMGEARMYRCFERFMDLFVKGVYLDDVSGWSHASQPPTYHWAGHGR